jgi:hypothetical protein
MKYSSLVIIFLFSSLIDVHRARAFVFDTNVLYYTDTTTAAKESSHGATMYDVLIGFDVDKKGMYQVGWNYSGHSTETKDDSTTISYKSTQMGPGFVFYFDKDRSWRLGFSYNLKTTATYTYGSGTEEEWRGSTMNGTFGYQLRFGDGFSLGIRMNYSSASYSEKVITTTKTDVSYKKSMIYPSIAITLDTF